MNTLKVYRVECIQGHGPYEYKGDDETKCCSFKGADYMSVVHSDSHHPLPYSDGLSGYDMEPKFLLEHRCGFISESDLFDWFRNFTEDLRCRGFVVAIYEIDDVDNNVVRGNHQIGFIRNNATLVDYKEFE